MLFLISIAKSLFPVPSLPGLDATSSLELLETLDKIRLKNRLVVVTIHQPRPEIFNMFTKLMLLAVGRVSSSEKVMSS